MFKKFSTWRSFSLLLFHHFLSVLYKMSPSDWINVGVPLGTMALAVFTWRSVKDSRESILAATRSAHAAEDSVEHLKDALKPLIDLDITGGSYYRHYVSDEEELRSEVRRIAAILTIRNTGTGPTRLGMMAYREDLFSENAKESIWMYRSENWSKQRVIDTIVAPGEKVVFVMHGSQKAYSDKSVSSLSIFYEDVYGRKFRTRLI